MTRPPRFVYRLLCVLTLCLPVAVHAGSHCADRALTLQILGSGGPVPDSERASSGYLVWIDGKARVMIDAGGGTFQRYGASGARIEDLDIIALSHFHTDHAADLPALLKGGFFSSRQRELPISGPSASPAFPDTGGYLSSLFDAGHGAFRYLAGFMDGSDGLFALRPIVIDVKQTEPTVVLKMPDLIVTALGVPHGIVPALAYRVDTHDGSIAFGGDQNGGNPAFARFVTGVDTLVLHMAIPDAADPVAARLHATPQTLGKIAAEAGPGQVVLSHFMARSLENLDANLAAVKRHTTGRVALASDLACIPVAGQ